ncbi:hypothetical protein [Rhodococcus rhodnii]|nr:hypothetical protein [Rhodococcus rhodnii]
MVDRHTRIDHNTDACPYWWCRTSGLVDEHNSLPDKYVTASLSMSANADWEGSRAPALAVGVTLDQAYDPDRLPSVLLHMLGVREDSEAELTLAEAVQLREQLDRAIGIVRQLYRDGFAPVSDQGDPTAAVWARYAAEHPNTGREIRRNPEAVQADAEIREGLQ